jgi:hypothetical protein
MKTIAVILALALAPIVTSGQSIFDKFEDMDGVTSVIVNQKMFKMLMDLQIETGDPEAQEMLNMVGKITGLRVLTTGDEKISNDMTSSVNSYLKSSNLQELMRIKDGEQTVKFYVKEGKDDNHVKELLMLVSGLKELTKGQDVTINGKKREIETVLLSLTGDIDLRQVSKLTNKMNVPGGDQLKKVGDKKKN